MDWQVGDKAVCVTLGPDPEYGLLANPGVELGAIYTVTDIRVSFRNRLGLVFAEILGRHLTFRFRKIHPDAHEPCEEEFRELLDSFKPKVPTNV